MNVLNKLLGANNSSQASFKEAAFNFARAYVIILIVLSPIALFSVVLKPFTPAIHAALPKNFSPAMPLFWFILAPFGIYLFCAIMLAISLIGGWHKLGRLFRAPHYFTDEKLFTWQSARVGIANYNNVLKIRVAPQGLYLACPFPFRLMHPPLLIPWQEITVIKKDTHIFGRVSVLLSIGKPKQATIMLMNPKLLQAAAIYLPELNL